MIGPAVFGFLPILIWLTLLFGRGMFWRARERDEAAI